MTMENEQIVQLKEQLARVEAERDRLAKRLCICHSCGGRGEVHTGQYTDEGQWQPPEPVMVECGECGGDGQIGQVIDLDTAQAQLAEAVGLYLKVRHIVIDAANVAGNEKYHAVDDAFMSLSRHAQAEQQEAKGAQAVDERAAFENWASDGGLYPQAVERRGDQYKLAQTHSYWQAWQARAALATQPAVRGAEHDQ